MEFVSGSLGCVFQRFMGIEIEGVDFQDYDSFGGFFRVLYKYKFGDNGGVIKMGVFFILIYIKQKIRG